MKINFHDDIINYKLVIVFYNDLEYNDNNTKRSRVMIKRNLTSKITAAITSTAMLLSYSNLSAFASSDAVWNTSSVDKQALSTIALGDTSSYFSKYIYTKIYNDSGNYYHIYDDNFYILSVFCQLRIVSENEFKATTDSYSRLYDLLTNIKDSSNDACKGTINIVKGIAYKYKKILICNPNYDGAKVNL